MTTGWHADNRNQVVLRGNPPEVRVSGQSGQNLCTEIIYIVLQTSA